VLTTAPADVVLSANVLHNAHDVAATLVRLRMTADDGMLAFVESSREHTSRWLDAVPAIGP
jgi:hypothetical protein